MESKVDDCQGSTKFQFGCVRVETTQEWKDLHLAQAAFLGFPRVFVVAIGDLLSFDFPTDLESFSKELTPGNVIV